jgi:hypothetical protein
MTHNFYNFFLLQAPHLVKPESRSYDFNDITYDHSMKKPLKREDFISKINSVANTSVGFSQLRMQYFF